MPVRIEKQSSRGIYKVDGREGPKCFSIEVLNRAGTLAFAEHHGCEKPEKCPESWR
jgi:hypothetical protein